MPEGTVYRTRAAHLNSDDHPLYQHPFQACLRWKEGESYEGQDRSGKASGPGTTDEFDLINGRFFRRLDMREMCIQAMDFASFVKENCARHARLEPVSQPTLPPSARAPPRPAAGAKTCKVCTEHRGVSDAPYSRID